MGESTARQRNSSTKPLTHDEASELLHAYVHEQMIGGSPARRYPELAAHLATCATCQADLAEMQAVVRQAANPEATPLSQVAGPDMSRMVRPSLESRVEGRAWFFDRVGHIWLDFSAELLESWRMPPLLGAARGEIIYRYADPSREADRSNSAYQPSVQVEISAEEDPTSVYVTVIIDSPIHPALDQSGIKVAAYLDDALWTATTDPAGCAYFPGIPRHGLDQLRIEITVDQRVQMAPTPVDRNMGEDHTNQD